MKKTFIRNRKVRYASITVVLTVLVITVTVLANAVFSTLAKRYTWYSYMISEGSYDVTEDCYTLLGEAFAQVPSKEVEIIFCDLPNEKNAMEDSTLDYVYQTALSLAARYPERIRVTCHDIWTNPTTVKQYNTMKDPFTGETSEISIKSTSVILVGEDYHRVYSYQEFFVFSNDADTSSVWAYNGEKKLAAGILRAINADSQVVCLTNNHGEAFYDYELLYLLDDAGYTIRYIDLHHEEIPENCRLIISYNPNSDLIADAVSAKSEIEILETFLSKEGNSFLVMIENGTPSLPNLESFLESWGVDCDYYTDRTTERAYRYMVQDAAQSLTSDGYTIYGEAVGEGKSATILEGLERPVVFKNATALSAAQGFVNNGDGSFTKENRTLYSLYESSDGSSCWANGKVVDGGNAMLMTLTEQTLTNGSSHVGVIASSDFSEKTFLQSAVYGNTDTLLRTLDHVGKDLVPEGLTIKPFSSTEISTITTSQMLRWTLVLSLTPAVVITLLGIGILVKRRRA
ncbi:MAG: Gldg family protein [Clostridia bacterium]|nr:Gldg family protein [Clostridia bacterium]